MTQQKTAFQSDAFTLQEIADGVFAAIDCGHRTGSNAAIVDLGGLTVVFDTFVNIDAARELRQACRALTGRDAGYVVLSHSHADHTAGCGAFGGAVVLSSAAVRGQIAEVVVEFEKERGGYADAILETEAALAASTDPVKTADLRNSLFFLKNLGKPGVEFRAPDIGYEGELLLHGAGRSLHLKSFADAHSKGDTVAWLPDCRVCLAGDLLFKDSHPWLGAGDPEGFLRALEDVLALGMERYVPGHGPLAGSEDVLLEMKYIRELLALVCSGHSSDEKDYSVRDLPPEFHGWNGLCFPWNVKFLIGRMQAKA